MTLNEIVGALKEISYDELRDVRMVGAVEGTFAYRVIAAYQRYCELLEIAKHSGFVGVGCITYAEKQLDVEGYTL
tara:strand:+ start:2047 stop:2271 length:225 start_codon:yes stop_codon:yes gene_type:complete